MIVTPEIDGVLEIRSSTARFLEAFQQRLEAGLLTGKPHPRSQYRVVDAAPDRIGVSAADWWTAINVGVNDVELRIAQPGSLHYRVRYWRWTAYVVALSAVLGVIGLALLLATDVPGYLARHPEATLPGLSVDDNLRVVWLMVVFWGFVWPWLLVYLHQRPLRRLVTRLIAEIDAGATAAEGTP